MTDKRTEEQREGDNGNAGANDVGDGNGNAGADRDRRRLSDNVEGIVGDVNKAVKVAIERGTDAAESLGENIRDTFQGIRTSRDNVVMVRIDDESLARVDELVDAGIMGSRSEAAAFLISEGIKGRQALFDRIAEKVQEIRRVKDELRNLVDIEGEDMPKTKAKTHEQYNYGNAREKWGPSVADAIWDKFTNDRTQARATLDEDKRLKEKPKAASVRSVIDAIVARSLGRGD